MKQPPTTQIRTFEMTCSVTHYMEGEKVTDFPNNIQDGLYEALERLAQQVQLPLAIVTCICRRDVDIPEDKPGAFFLHVLASEVVVADARTINAGSSLIH